MTKKVSEQVAQEKKRLALRAGVSPAKAEVYAQEVRDYYDREAKKQGK